MPEEVNVWRRSTSRPGVFVLVVDDMADIRELYERYFQFRGLRVETAADGVLALQALAAEKPDVLVIDLSMPNVSGWDVIRSLRNDARMEAIPIVALSGMAASDSALAAGADVYLEKPCGPESVLREVLRLHRDKNKPESSSST